MAVMFYRNNTTDRYNLKLFGTTRKIAKVLS